METMKRIAYIWLAGLVVAGTLSPLGGQAQTEPLGDYARTVRKDKEKQPPAAKKYDNDNLPKNDDLSVVGNATAEPADTAASSEPKADDKTADSKNDQLKASDEWKKKIADQKDQIDLLSRELDVLQREYRLRAAAFYADAGNRLRDAGGWDKQDAQYKQQISAKQKALDDAKKQLDDLQEQARKSPTSAPAPAQQ
jgi:hypothetical protein